MGLLITFLKGILSFIFTKTVPKFFFFAGLYYVVLEFTPVIISLIGGDAFVQNINSALSSLPSGVLYFMSLFKLGTGLEIVLSAYVVRFIIKRIPIIG